MVVAKPGSFVVALVATLAASAGAARAARPVALVEEVTGAPQSVELMDYVEPGKVIKLAAKDTLVLSYIKPCWRETIAGGIVTVGAEQSAIEGGNITREKVACDGGKMEFAAAQSKQAAAMVFRGTGHTPPPKPEFTIYARSPVIELPGDGTVSLERVDKAGEKLDVTIAEGDLVHHQFYDMAKAGKSLQPGGVYRAKTGNQQLVFQVDSGAKTDGGPLAGRLVRFQAAH